MLEMKDVIRRVSYPVVTFASTRPALYYGIRKLTGKLDHLCINTDTELVIEGYPRSANSTVVHEFLARQPRPVRIAHHKHHAAQILVAVDRGLPAVLLIRDPKEAALSNLALILEARHRRGLPEQQQLPLGFDQVLHSWVAFYRAVVGCVDDLVIAPFEEVTQDLGSMIRAINTKFGTDFIDTPPVETPIKPLGWHATPNEIRNTIKRRLAEDFADTLAGSARVSALLDEANTLHQRLIEIHERRR
ncbi:MAG: hypothetical protein SNJ68_02640 [Cyanobacteriota bacterium]